MVLIIYNLHKSRVSGYVQTVIVTINNTINFYCVFCILNKKGKLYE